MADTASDADKIRNKRLAKLSAQNNATPNAEPSDTSTPAATDDQTFPSISSNPPQTEEQSPAAPNITVPTPTASPAPTQPIMKSSSLTNGEERRLRISPANSGRVTPSKRDSSGSAARSSSRAEETVEGFEDRTLRAVFKLSLDESQQGVRARGDEDHEPLHYVGGVRDELSEQGKELRINVEVLDQALLEVAQNPGKTPPLDYLLACWKRISKLYRNFRNPNPANERFNIVKEARRLCMSYCIFAITIPEMFGLDTPSSNPLISHLLLHADDKRAVCVDFLTEANVRTAEDDSLREMWAGIAEELSRQLAKLTMVGPYQPYVAAMKHLVRYAHIADSIAESTMFGDKATDAPNLETATLLGPYFAISPLQAEVTTSYFSSPKTMDQGTVINSQRALRITLKTHQDDLLEIVNQMIRKSKTSRESVLDWFALVVNTNHKRRAMQVDPKTVSSDGFMINVTSILDRLCDPFMDATFSKIDKIDVNYLRRHPRVDMKDETKLNADQATSDSFYSEKVDGESNFISEVFFLTVAAHHYGTEAANSRMEQLEKDLRHMEKQIDKFEMDRHKYVGNPVMLQQFETALKKYKDQIDKGLSYKHAVQGVLLDDMSQALSMQFMRYVIVWMLRLVSTDFPATKLKLPLATPQPDNFSCLPEYFLDDIVSNFKFIMWNMPHVITSTQADELVLLCISLLSSSEDIKNPYLKSGLVSILFRGTWPRRNGSKGVLVELLYSMPFANEHLLHALMKFYIDAEFTGTHTQFFDKFNIRYEIFQVIKTVWGNPVYRDKLFRESKLNSEFFVRFVNLLLNDVTFVLDESFTAFLSIHDIQLELNRDGNTMDANQRTEKEEQLTSAQGRAKSYMQLTNETVAMLNLFTEALADSFTMPEIVQRLADMLDYNLDAMVGEKSRNLKVGNLQEYNFNPRTLLAEIVEVYINLGEKDNFILAVARDGRSYKPENFRHSDQILKKFALKSAEKIVKWQALQKKFAAAKEADDQAEEDLGEIPDDFLDPLMYTLMEDPVILPKSKVTVDRSTIRSHLLSDPTDPFNRVPMTIEEVTPDIEMKAKIQAFKDEKKNAKMAKITSAIENAEETMLAPEVEMKPDDTMDTASG